MPCVEFRERLPACLPKIVKANRLPEGSSTGDFNMAPGRWDQGLSNRIEKRSAKRLVLAHLELDIMDSVPGAR